MREIEIQERNLEVIEIEGEKKEVYKSNANSIRGLICGLIQKFSKDVKKGKTYTPKELEIIFSEILRKFNELYPQSITKIKIIEGWEKNGNDFPIWKDIDNDFVIEIWRDDKKDIKKVNRVNLNNMLKAIRKMKIGKRYKCYDVAEFLGMNWKYIWGNRMSVYFPRYYSCLKIFNELGVVNYGGNHKTIIRLK